MDMKTISWGKSKLVLFGSVLFFSSLFFGGQAKAADCIWTAGAAANYSSTTVWKDDAGIACNPATSTLLFRGASSTANIIFDVSTTTQGITFDSAYTGTATVTSSVVVTTVGSVTAQGGAAGAFTIAQSGQLIVGTNVNVSSTASFTVNGVLTLGGNLTVTSTLTSGVVGVVDFTFNGSGHTISGPGNITFDDLHITGDNTVTLNSSVTTTGDLIVWAGNTFDLGTYNVVAGGNFTNNGTITQTSGTVTMSGTGDFGGSGSTTIVDLRITGTTTLGDISFIASTTVVSGVLNGGVGEILLTGSGTPLSISGTFNVNTSSITYWGATANVAATTYYNLNIRGTDTLIGNVTTTNDITVNSDGVFDLSIYNVVVGRSFTSDGTITQTSGTVTMSGTGNLGGTGTTQLTGLLITGTTTLANTVTASTTNVSGVLNGGAAAVLALTGVGTPLTISGTFTPQTGTVSFTNAGAVTIVTSSYYGLILGAGGTYTLGGTSTSTNAFTNNGTFVLSSYDLVASGSYANNATTTESGAGRVKKAATDGLTATTYISGTANGTGNTISISLTDPTANLLAGTVETKSVTLAATTYSDSETVTVTETDVGSGVFTGSIPFNITNAAAANSKLDVSGSGSVTLAYVNGHGALSGAGASASYSGSAYAAPSSGGGYSPTAPSVSSVTISSGSQTAAQTVTLSLLVTNVTQVAISEDPNFTNASWEPYVPTKSLTLSSGAGEKTVYVKFLSASGGVTSVYKVNVTLKEGYVTIPTVAASTTITPVVAQFKVSSPNSKVVISPVKTLVYNPGSVVKYTYAYKNETSKTIKVKVVRQVEDSNGKVVTKVTGNTSIIKGKTFKFDANNALSSKLIDGVYTIKIQVLDFKTGVLIAENSFNITIKKPLPPPAILSTNPDSKVVITGLKVDYKAGNTVKYVYSYKNETGKILKVKIVRQVVGANGSVISQVAGTRTLSKGQTFKFNATSALSSKLSVGTYTATVKVLDDKNVVLAENGFDLIVKK